MAERTFDIESLLEDQFISILSGQASTSAYTLKVWEDEKDMELTPLIRVKASLSDEIDGVFNLYQASNIIVDFGVFTTKRRDNDGRIANEMRGNIRNVIAQTDIVSLLNEISGTSGLFVYDNGVIPQESFEVEDKKLYQKGISVLVVSTTIDT